jgi:hypothetical protein
MDKVCLCKKNFDFKLNGLNFKQLKEQCKNHKINIKLSNKAELVEKLSFYYKYKNYNFNCVECNDLYDRDLYQIEIKEQLRKDKALDVKKINSFLQNASDEYLLGICDFIE